MRRLNSPSATTISATASGGSASIQRRTNGNTPSTREWVKWPILMKSSGMAFVKEYPGEFMRLCLKRFDAFWTGSELITDAWPRWFFWPLSALMFAGLLVALAYRVNGSWLFFWLMLCYPLTYYIVFAQPRYRHPIEPEMLLLGTYFVSSALRDLAARFRTVNPTGLPRVETAA